MTTPEHGLCVIISGTPSTGFVITGPFKHPSFASEWASVWEDDVDWWVASLVAQETRQVRT